MSTQDSYTNTDNLNQHFTAASSHINKMTEQIEFHHSYIFNLLFIILCFSSIKLLLLFKSPIFYKRFIDWLFNLEFNLFGIRLTAYFLTLNWILFLILSMVVFKSQHNQYTGKFPTETPSVRFERLKNKWILEAEMWMTFIVLIEWM